MTTNEQGERLFYGLTERQLVCVIQQQQHERMTLLRAANGIKEPKEWMW